MAELNLADHLRNMLNEVEAFIDNVSTDKLDQHSPEFIEDYIKAAKYMERYHGRKNHRVKGAERILEILWQDK